MKPIGDAARKAEKAIRHKRWQWCRRWNGFSDRPLWRTLAVQLQLPIHQIVAFAGKLEELANEAEQRGQLDRFDPVEFGVALDMPASDAEAIYAALLERRWIEYGAIADFFYWNRDEEKEDQNARQQRSRDRKKVRLMLAALERTGRVDKTERLEVELGLKDIDDAQLATLLVELRRLELSTGAPVTNVTSDIPVRRPAVDNPSARVTSVTSDSVTVTPEQSTHIQVQPVDNSGDVTRERAEALSDEEVAARADDPQGKARQWIAESGRKLVVERMDVPLTRADVLIERWLHQQLGGDAVALTAILQAEEARGYLGPRFHTDVTDAIARHQRTAAAQLDGQGRLPLGGLHAVGKRSA